MKTIILCGGMGTRLREETEYKPKPMVEIGGKPILWHIMKHYSYYGFNEFILALGYKGDVIRDYFLNYYNYNRDFTVDLSTGDVKIENECSKNDWKVTLVETGDESMTGYRTRLCGKYITEDRFYANLRRCGIKC
jgi:glucose-1-phosphate cytidylyltransferase